MEPSARALRKSAGLIELVYRSRANTLSRTIDELERVLARSPKAAYRPEDTVRARARAVLDAVGDFPCAALVANDRGRYIVVNDAAVALTGYTRAELLRMSVWDLTPAPGLAAGHELWRRFLLEQPRMRGTSCLRRKDGSQVRADYLALANVIPGMHVSVLMQADGAASPHVVRRSARKRGTG